MRATRAAQDAGAKPAQGGGRFSGEGRELLPFYTDFGREAAFTILCQTMVGHFYHFIYATKILLRRAARDACLVWLYAHTVKSQSQPDS